MANEHDATAPDPAAHGSTGDHGAAHADDAHGHGGGEPLGPLDLKSWGAAILGIVLGLVVVAALLLASP